MTSLLRYASLGALWATAFFAFTSCKAAGGDLSLSEASPATVSARGGETLTLRGSGFTSVTSVRIAGAPAPLVKLVSDKELTITVPPLFAGSASVTADAGGRHAELAGGVQVAKLDLHLVEAPPFAFPVGVDATVAGAALGDFDGSGRLDLITCAATAPCQFFANDGRGNFVPDQPDAGASARFPAFMPDADAGADGGPGAADGGVGSGSGATALVAADLDHDGHLDLYVGLVAGGGTIYRNNGNARFTDVGASLPAEPDPVSAVAVGDVDGDGRLDLVVASAKSSVVPLRVYLNKSTPGSMLFVAAPDGTLPAMSSSVTAIALADVDGDGHLDIVVATPGAADGIPARVLLNKGGKFVVATDRLPGPADETVAAIAAGDVTGDGAVDLVLVCHGQHRLLVNDGSGHFFDATGSSMPVNASKGTSIAMVDLDRDRHLDLVIGHAGAETRLYLNDGTGHFFDDTPVLPIYTDATVWIGSGDVDGDATNDVIVLNAAPGPSRLYLSVEPPANASP